MEITRDSGIPFEFFIELPPPQRINIDYGLGVSKKAVERVV